VKETQKTAWTVGILVFTRVSVWNATAAGMIRFLEYLGAFISKSPPPPRHQMSAMSEKHPKEPIAGIREFLHANAMSGNAAGMTQFSMFPGASTAMT